MTGSERAQQRVAAYATLQRLKVDGLEILREALEDTAWTSFAACKDAPMDAAYGGPDTVGNELSRRVFTYIQNRLIRLYCDRCPVLYQCREAGIDERYGVWGGLTPTERNRSRAKAVHV